jgi:DNA-binding protein HU-beta
MNKQEIVAKVAESAGIQKTVAEKAVDAVFASITSALASGDKFSLVGFGSFDVGARAARTGRNPATGKEINIPASKSVRFKAGKALKDAVK